jgi:hypothetical protein
VRWGEVAAGFFDHPGCHYEPAPVTETNEGADAQTGQAS